MARPRTAMRRIREVLRLSLEAGLGAQQISLATGLPRTTVRRYLERASQHGVTWPLPEGMDDRMLEERLFGRRPATGAAQAIPARPHPDWHEGAYRTASDALILEKAAAAGLTPVTYDAKTIPLLLRAWAEARRSHAGVVLIDEKTIWPNDVGALVRSLIFFWDERQHEDWSDRVAYLGPAPIP